MVFKFKRKKAVAKKEEKPAKKKAAPIKKATVPKKVAPKKAPIKKAVKPAKNVEKSAVKKTTRPTRQKVQEDIELCAAPKAFVRKEIKFYPEKKLTADGWRRLLKKSSK